jgi:hypothetical protein
MHVFEHTGPSCVARALSPVSVKRSEHAPRHPTAILPLDLSITTPHSPPPLPRNIPSITAVLSVPVRSSPPWRQDPYRQQSVPRALPPQSPRSTRSTRARNGVYTYSRSLPPPLLPRLYVLMPVIAPTPSRRAPSTSTATRSMCTAPSCP